MFTAKIAKAIAFLYRSCITSSIRIVRLACIITGPATTPQSQGGASAKTLFLLQQHIKNIMVVMLYIHICLMLILIIL